MIYIEQPSEAVKEAQKKDVESRSKNDDLINSVKAYSECVVLINDIRDIVFERLIIGLGEDMAKKELKNRYNPIHNALYGIIQELMIEDTTNALHEYDMKSFQNIYHNFDLKDNPFK